MKLTPAAVVLVSTLLCLPAQDAEQPGLDPAAAGPAMRIWSHREAGMQEVWFRRDFELASAPKNATFVFTCDNVATVFVNGKRVAHSDRWEDLTIIDVARMLQKGKNVITIHAKNEGSCAALAAWLTWAMPPKRPGIDGETGEIVTDAKWVYSDDEHDGWTNLAFDVSKWNAANATLATPYGNNVYNGKPLKLRFENGRTETADAIAQALERFRGARTPAAAKQALDALDRAVMEARVRLWKEKAVGGQKWPGRARKRD